jgi:acyl carrier protein
MNSDRSSDAVTTEVLRILRETVGDHALPREVGEHTRLLGEIAELDSMALLGLLTRVEERFDVRIDDSRIEAAIFETVGSLTRFVEDVVSASQQRA